MGVKQFRGQLLFITLLVLIAGVMVVGCSPAEPETITVVETVVVEKEVQSEPVTVVETVEVEVVATATPAARGGALVLSTPNFPSGLDPHVQVVWDVLLILSNVYDTLVYQDAEGNFVPGLAESWEVSDDGTTYTFQLRDDVTFHDGTPFNAEAVKYNLDRVVAPETKSQKAAGLLGPYESSEVIDEYTIQINLSEPHAYLLHGLSLTYLGMASPAALEEWGEEYQLHQVGTGPFIFQEYVPQDHVTLVPNPDYNWAPEIYGHQGPPYLEEVTVRFLPEPATRLPALEAGDVDIALDVPASDGNRVLDNPNLELRITNLTGQPLFWFMNTEMSPTDDILVRQAILHATDRQTAGNAVFRGFVPVAYGPLSVVTPEYNAELAGMYPFDPVRAAELLEEAGWTDSDGDGIRDKDGQPLTIAMSLQGWGFTVPLGEILQGQLRQVGIDVEMEQMTWPGQMEAGINGTKNMTVMGGSGFFASDAMTGFFHSKNIESGFNWSKINSPELDTLLDEASQTTDFEARKALYDQAQMMIMEEALILPVYDYTVLAGVNNKIQGLSWSSIGLAPVLYDVYVAESQP